MGDDLGIDEEDLGGGDPRCPLVLLLDTSTSMRSAAPDAPASPIDQLNSGLVALSEELNSDRVARRRVEVLVVPFGGSVRRDGEFALAWDWTPEKLGAHGGTPMGEAIRFGLQAANERRRSIQAEGTISYRPWVFLLTDGAPTDDMTGVADEVQSAVVEKRANFFAIAAVGADESILKTLNPDGPVLRLDNTDWSSLFKWMSAAMSSVARSSPGDQAAIPAWTITA